MKVLKLKKKGRYYCFKHNFKTDICNSNNYKTGTGSGNIYGFRYTLGVLEKNSSADKGGTTVLEKFNLTFFFFINLPTTSSPIFCCHHPFSANGADEGWRINYICPLLIGLSLFEYRFSYFCF